MDILLSVLGWLGLALLLGVLALLATPLRLSVVGEAGEGLRARVLLGFFGGWAPAIPVYDSARPRKEKVAKPKPKPTKRRAKMEKGVRIGRALPGLFMDVLRCIRFDGLRLKGRFGFEDPADTGALWGRLTPLLYAGPALPAVDIAVAPDFETAVIEGRVEAAIRLVPIALVPPFARFGWRVFGPRR